MSAKNARIEWIVDLMKNAFASIYVPEKYNSTPILFVVLLFFNVDIIDFQEGMIYDLQQ